MKKEIDLKLLKVIHSIVTTGTVTGAARQLNQSPGNISYQLGKVRAITGAHLFIRTNSGMKPDATALELSQRYQHYAGPETNSGFHSSLSQRTNININTFSLIEILLSMNILGRESASSDFRYVFNAWNANPEERLYRLKNQLTDIDIGNKLPPDPAISSIKLFTSGVSVLIGREHRTSDEPLSLQELRKYRHVTWSMGTDYYSKNMGNAGTITNYIQSRDVAVVSGSMINMVSLCANSDSIMLVPEFFAPVLEGHFPVKCVQLPPELAVYYDCFLHCPALTGAESDSLAQIQHALESMRMDFQDVH